MLVGDFSALKGACWCTSKVWTLCFFLDLSRNKEVVFLFVYNSQTLGSYLRVKICNSKRNGHEKMKTVQPGIFFVCLSCIPPVHGVAWEMRWWLQKPASACLLSRELSPSLSLGPRAIPHSCHLYWQPSFAGLACKIKSFSLIQVNHLGSEHLSVFFCIPPSLHL